MVEVSQRGRVLKPGEVTYSVVRVVSQRDGRSDDTTEIEYGPEDADEAPLLGFGGIPKHQGSLSRPQQTCANTEDSTHANNIPAGIGVDVYDTARRDA